MRMITRASAALFVWIAAVSPLSAAPSPNEAKEIAKEVFIYAYPMVENYYSMYAWAIDEEGDQYKGSMNTLASVAQLFGPNDTGVVTPNSDAMFSFLVMDLRREPLVVTMPPIEKERYYSLQLVDLYTHNYDYLGTRRDGNGGGDFLIAGPNWEGEKPEGIKRIVQSPTELMFSQFRTQLINPEDMDNVKQIQAGYKVEPLSAYLGTKAPVASPAIDYPPIKNRELIESDTFRYVNFLLQFSPELEGEQDLRERFTEIGVEAGESWPPKLSDEVLQAIEDGRKAGIEEINEAAGKITSSLGLFGTPEEMVGKNLERAIGAKLGLYGNNSEEAFYPAYQVDAQGEPLDASKHSYQITFQKGELPPAGAFWSMTMYDAKTRLLVENPLDRYLLNSPMLPDMKFNADGSLTLFLQKDTPGKDMESNWLPAPEGPMWVVMRIYMPNKSAIDGTWKAPALERIET